jgi:hypothetical protein
MREEEEESTEEDKSIEEDGSIETLGRPLRCLENFRPDVAMLNVFCRDCFAFYYWICGINS